MIYIIVGDTLTANSQLIKRKEFGKMNCEKCGCEMMVSHIEKEVIDGTEQHKKVYVCINEKCYAYGENSKLKKQKAKGI